MTPTRSSRRRLRGGIPGIEQFPFITDGGSPDIGYQHYGTGRGRQSLKSEQRGPIAFQQDMQAAITIQL